MLASPRALFRTKKRKVAVLLAGGLPAVLIAGGAFAYITAIGTGSGSFTDTQQVAGGNTQTQVSLTVAGTLDSVAVHLAAPGTSIDPSNGGGAYTDVQVTNSSTNVATVDFPATTYTITSDSPSCPAGSFTWTPYSYLQTPASNGAPANGAEASLPSDGNGGTGTAGAPPKLDMAVGSFVTVDGALTWNEDGQNQDGCLGSHLTLAVNIPQ